MYPQLDSLTNAALIAESQTTTSESSTEQPPTASVTDSETEPFFPCEGVGEPCDLENSAIPLTDTNAITSGFDMHSKLANSEINTGISEVLGWSLAAVSTALFFASLASNIIMLWVYEKRQSKDNNVETPMYKMEGNPCYEASNLKQIAATAGEQEAHVFERVKQK